MRMIAREQAVIRFAFLAETAETRPATKGELTAAYRRMAQWIRHHDRSYPNTPVICRRTSGGIVAVDPESMSAALRRVALARASAPKSRRKRSGARTFTTPEGTINLRRATL